MPNAFRLAVCLAFVLFCAAPASAEDAFWEVQRTFSAGPGVRARVIARAELSPREPVRLIIYALPNGNTIEETLGHAVPLGDKSRFGIQQIAGQLRLLREKVNPNFVLACVEARGLSWPAWRKKHGDAAIPRIVDSLVARFAPAPVQVTLSGHSGGGSFIFGYINAQPEISSRIERIAFLDANYGYETEKHAAKIANWLERSRSHRLCVLAYRDDLARWNGRPFVSITGGTAGRSKVMIADLGRRFAVRRSRKGDIDTTTVAAGRAHFFIHQNPSAINLHTVQVERNGFIHAMLTGTRHANRGYRYLGEPAYGEWVAAR